MEISASPISVGRRITAYAYLSTMEVSVAHYDLHSSVSEIYSRDEALWLAGALVDAVAKLDAGTDD